MISGLVDFAKSNAVSRRRRALIAGHKMTEKREPENEGGKETSGKAGPGHLQTGVRGFEPTGSNQLKGTCRGLKHRGAIRVASFWPTSAVMLT